MTLRNLIELDSGRSYTDLCACSLLYMSQVHLNVKFSVNICIHMYVHIYKHMKYIYVLIMDENRKLSIFFLYNINLFQ